MKFLRLRGTTASQLPATNATTESLSSFLGAIVREAAPFVDGVDVVPPPPSGDGRGGDYKERGVMIWRNSGKREGYSDSEAGVDLFERVVDVAVVVPGDSPSDADAEIGEGGDGDGEGSGSVDGRKKKTMRTVKETWVCRRSVHRDASERGTAGWDEFKRGFKERHVETEAAFVGTVVGYELLQMWDCKGVNVQQQKGTETTHYGAFTLSLLTIRHRIGRPILKDRSFPILQVTCSAMDNASQKSDQEEQQELPEFLVVTIPVAGISSFSANLGVSSSPPPTTQKQENTRNADPKDKDTVEAAYVSVERIRKLGGDIEWIMAAASDARGVLPRVVQNMAVPGQIAKDVPKFLAWIAREREQQQAQERMVERDV